MSIDRPFLQAQALASTATIFAQLRAAKKRVEEAKATKVVVLNGFHYAEAPAGETIADAPRQESDSALQFFPPVEEAGLILPGFVPDDSQKAAVELLKENPEGCLIGAAGTGKTTIMRYLVHELIYNKRVAEHPNDFAFVSFTGTASQIMAKNLPRWLRHKCMTIHSLLEYAPSEELIESTTGGNAEMKFKFMPRRTENNKFTEKILFIDETSMVPMPLWHEMQAAMQPGIRVYAIGDLNQIPPFGGSSAFGFMLAEKKVAELTTIHRQADPRAQGIIDAAHKILRGENPSMEDGSFEHFQNGEWSVWGFELNQNPMTAANQIVALLAKLHTVKTPEGEVFYDPHRDRIVTPGNGYADDTTKSLVQQAPLNRALAPYFDPPSEEHPVYIIDAGASQQEFAQGFRVMATKNEPPGTKDRVTNGMLGRIVEIKRNLVWDGDWGIVGPVAKVQIERTKRINALFGKKESGISDDEATNVIANLQKTITTGTERDKANLTAQIQAAQERGRFAGPASHTVVVSFENGCTREFVSQVGVDSLQLAYATTVAKAQGAQHNTVVVILHQICKSQLNREVLYTAVTRASRRVIMLYTPFGLNIALTKQRIRGNTLAEKIKRYSDFIAGGGEM